MNLNLNLSDASGGSSHVSTFGPCCVPSPPWESEVKRSQFLLMSSVTSSNMNKMGIEIKEGAKDQKKGIKCSWGSEIRK